MAIEKIKIPDLGDALDVEVIEICVQPGDVVSKDDSIIVLESEKAAMEIPASVSGKVIDIKVNNGDTVNEGSIFLEIEAEDSPVEESPTITFPSCMLISITSFFFILENIVKPTSNVLTISPTSAVSPPAKYISKPKDLISFNSSLRISR